jgi:hypothetical protein
MIQGISEGPSLTPTDFHLGGLDMFRTFICVSLMIASGIAGAATEEALTAEAFKMGKDILAKTFSNCAGKVFFYKDIGGANFLHEAKKATYRMTESRMATGADKLNGTEWRGQVQLVFEAVRMRRGKGQSATWGPWEGGEVSTINLAKINGKFEVIQRFDTTFGAFRAANCAEAGNAH